jgi:hypothetical protein
MKSDQKTIRVIAIAFSCVVVIPAIISPLSPFGDLLLKLVFLTYSSLIFWTTLRVWAAVTTIIFATFAAWEFYLTFSELWNSPSFWWNYLMYGSRQGAHYYGDDGATGDFFGLVMTTCGFAVFGGMAIIGFSAYLKLKSEEQTMLYTSSRK